MKKKLKALIMIIVMVQMVLGSTIAAFAADDDDKEVAGAPQVLVVNGPIFDVTAGEDNEVTVSIKNLSSYVAKSVIIMPQIAVVDGNPLHISLKETSNNLSAISPNAGKNLTFVVGVDKGALAKTYAVDVKFNFYNTDGVNYETKSTIYFKVKGATTENNIFFEDFIVEPDTLEVGGTGKIGVTVKNRGPLSMYGVEISLDGLDPTLISAKGVSSKKISNIMAGTKESFTFDIASNSEMASGNYPITFKVTCKDENGTAYAYEQKYYVVVGGSSSGKKSDVVIKNLVEPSGVYGVNQNFEIKFDVANNGTATAKNVRVTAKEYGEGSNVVPKTSSVISLDELAAGASKGMSFTFAATGSASTRNYTVELKVEYEQNGKAVSFSQYAGANVSNPEKDKEDDKDKKESKPKIIISQYSSDPIIVMAGGEFDLTMTFLNTHAEKAVKNVKMYLTMAEETSSESTKTGNIFTPVDSSNTFYFDSIPAKGTAEKKLRLYVVPDAQPKTYTIKVNFEYEDDSKTEYTSTELLGVNVKQSTNVETSEIVIPETSELYMPISVYFDIFNTGKVALSNLKVTLEGDIDTTSKSTYIGNCASGESGYYEGSFSVINEGENNVKLTISYDDASGEKVEEVHEYTITGTAPVPMDENMDGEDMPTPNGANVGNGKIAAIVCGVVVLIVIAVVIFKKKRAKKEARFIEADLDDEIDNVVEAIGEGKDNNEQL